MKHILLVEDEESFADPLSYYLQKEGYRVSIAADGEQALQLFTCKNFDLILLDLMLPIVSGTEVCKEIRKSSNIPIIMLTAKDDEFDKVLGLELGADDYVTKPYSSRELLARIKAVLRRQGEATATEVDALRVGDLVMDIERHVVTLSGVELALPLREFELLEMLMLNAERVLTRGQLLDRIWGPNYVGDSKTLDVHVKRLRSKIETDPREPRILQTVRGVGFKLTVGQN